MSADLRIEFEKSNGLLMASDNKTDYLGRYSCFIEGEIYYLKKENEDLISHNTELSQSNIIIKTFICNKNLREECEKFEKKEIKNLT